MKHLLPALLILSACFLSAQSPKYQVLSVPVMRYGAPVREPWTGGMDSPQFSEVDLNNDGIKDLFVFDRVGNRVLTYLSNGDGSDTMYRYAPQYESLFPSGLQNWALLVDYNNDGIPDLFTSGPGPGISVYKGSKPNGLLHYDLVNVRLHLDTPIQSPIPANLVDLPAFIDVNGDGDLDILVYDQFGTSISYYENQTVEHGGTGRYNVDSLTYDLVTTCWGNITQSNISNSISLNQSCKGGGGYGDVNGDTSVNVRHLGNSLYPLIDPIYNDVDLLNGNLQFNDLFLLQNCGGRTFANVCAWDSIFLTCNVAILMPSYPAAFGIDANNDGMTDMLVSPNVQGLYVVGASPARNTQNVMLYKATGDTSCWYSYAGDTFLVDHTLDFSSMSRGQFYDLDGDGLKDIVISGYGYYNIFLPISSLAFYKNTGTATHPQYTEESLDYDGLTSQQLVAFSPTFGDMDGDGKNDMVVGDNQGLLYFFKNTDTGNGSSFPAMTANWTNSFGIQVSSYFATPLIYDVNGDSLNDLIVGQGNGSLTYFKNIGTKTNPVFSNDSSIVNFGKVNVRKGTANYGYSQPFIMKDSTGRTLLFVGSLSGAVYEYLLDASVLPSGAFTLIDSDFLHQYVGAASAISISDINNDGKLEYMVGTATGGLLLYSDSLWDSSALPLAISDAMPVNPSMQIFPNPAHDYFICKTDGGFINPKLQMWNVFGEAINPETEFTNGQLTVRTQFLSNGFYIVQVSDGTKSYLKKVIVFR